MAFDPCRFADCLAKYEAIWNVRAKDHGNKDKRKAQLQALADECDISVDLAETKYTSLRTYFVKQRRKVKESQRNGFGIGETYRPSWPPYSSLIFLEKTLDLQNNTLDFQNNTLDFMPDGNMRISMVDRVPHPDLARPITMVDLSGGTIPDTSDDLAKTPPEVNTIILSMPDNSRSPTPVVSPLPETTMRIPMPEGLRVPIKIESKDVEDDLVVPRTDISPTPASPVSSSPYSTNSYPSRPTETIYNTFPPHVSSTSSPSNTLPTPSHSMVLSSYPLTFPHPLPCAPSTPLIPLGKNRKRNGARQENSGQLGVILQDAIDNLRTITNKEECNDDISGFLKMVAYQLRSIQDPIRRMRLMHSIQGLMIHELSSSSPCKNSDHAVGDKYPDTMDAFELST